ncbi:LysR family transcriptional regulator [Burkholderia sp. WAC0059]|uniref:LysR family transcriptional regulator n=1 Tax=Burkholderia sp. WAC0059 TaxID=2066022 RepID=UPI0015E0A937|nr:LysR family transcriptional regulator [Burkholderia sp. WAC0059]
MELSYLRALLAVIETGTLSKAADRLGLTQPAVSRQIRLLEEQLGVVLFARHGRGMTPNDIARRIASRAAAGFRELDAIARDVSETRQDPGGTVILGLTPLVADMAIVPLINLISRKFPNIRLKFAIGFSGYLLDWLHREEVEVALLFDPIHHHSLSVQPLLKDELVLVGAGYRRFSMEIPFEFARLAGERLVLPSLRHGIRMMVDRQADARGAVLDVAIEADSFPVLRDLVIAGHGSTILPLNSVRSEIEAGKVSVTRLVPDMFRKLALARSTTTHQSTASKAVCVALAEFLIGEVESGRLAADILVNPKHFDGRV